MNYYLGIDQGSSATKGALIALTAGRVKVLWQENIPVATIYGRDQLGYVTAEQDGAEILRSVQAVLKSGKQFAESSQIEISGIGLDCQRSGVIAWKVADGSPVSALISHQDRRFSPVMVRLQNSASYITSKVGLPLLAGYAAPKIAALQKEFPTTEVLVATLDSYLAFNLLDTHNESPEGNLARYRTDDSMAARTLLYSLASGEWDSDLADLFDVDIRKLPAIKPSLCLHGTVSHGLGSVTPLLAILGDQQAVGLAALAASQRQVLNLGTIASLINVVEAEPAIREGVYSSVLCSDSASADTNSKHRIFLNEYVLEECATLLAHAATITGCQVGEIDKIYTDTLAECITRKGYDSPVGFTKNLAASDKFDFSSDDISNGERVVAIVEHLGCKVIQLLRASGSTGGEIAVSGGVAQCLALLRFIAAGSGCTLKKYHSHNLSAIGAAVGAIYGLRSLNEELTDEAIFAPLVTDLGDYCLVAPDPVLEEYAERRFRLWQGFGDSFNDE